MREIYKNLSELKKLYASGENIVQHLLKNHSELSKIEAIMLSYDLQAGSYSEAFDKNPDRKIQYCQELVEKMSKLGHFNSILNVGVGEATILGNFVSLLKDRPSEIYGIDISWSRVYKAVEFMKRFDIENFQFMTGDLFYSPFMDNSIEMVFSNHSLEPNGGREEEALKELYRISSKYIVINEPCYEWASTEAKERIEKHGYVKNLHLVAEKLGYEIVSHEPFTNPVSVLNPTSCLIIKKEIEETPPTRKLACPWTKTELNQKEGYLYSAQSLLSYPIIENIACLNPNNAIMTSAID